MDKICLECLLSKSICLERNILYSDIVSKQDSLLVLRVDEIDLLQVRNAKVERKLLRTRGFVGLSFVLGVLFGVFVF